MSNLVQWARKNVLRSSPWPSVSVDQLPYLFSQFGYNGLGYGPGLVQTIQQNRETIRGDFVGFMQGAYKTNGAIFSVMLTRAMLFSEVRFQFRRINNGRPGKLFGTQDLQLLETPWPNGTTGDLTTRAISDVDLSGNFYATIMPLSSGKGQRIVRLRPDWMTIILGSWNDADVNQWDPSAELLGYIYQPGGYGSGKKAITYLADQVMHWAPIPDPVATYRGMSWIEPVLQEIIGDKLMNTHKEMYFTNGASPNLVVSMDTARMNREGFIEWVDTFEQQHEGAANAYKTLYLGQGANATIVGNSLKELDYAIVQGHGETRIAAAGRMPAIIVGFSEGLEASTYSNFAQARRAAADGCLRPLWRSFCGSLAPLINVPPGSELWYDDRDVAFLSADQQDTAEVQASKASAMLSLVNSGYEPDSVVDAIESDDFSLLVHSGLYSVQLQKPGSKDPTADPPVGPAAPVDETDDEDDEGAKPDAKSASSDVKAKLRSLGYLPDKRVLRSTKGAHLLQVGPETRNNGSKAHVGTER